MFHLDVSSSARYNRKMCLIYLPRQVLPVCSAPSKVGGFMCDVCIFSPTTSDLVEDKHGHLQAIFGSFRGKMKMRHTAVEESFLSSINNEFCTEETGRATFLASVAQ